MDHNKRPLNTFQNVSGGLFQTIYFDFIQLAVMFIDKYFQ